MLRVPEAPLCTVRLTLKRLRAEDAAAMWSVLRDPEIYRWVDRAPPADESEIGARFARITASGAGAPDQWLNWTVWTDEEPVGLVEATVRPDRSVAIAYMFARRIWRRGYAREAVAALIALLVTLGAASFEAAIDVGNTASIALAKSLGFKRSGAAANGEEMWRLIPAHAEAAS